MGGKSDFHLQSLIPSGVCVWPETVIRGRYFYLRTTDGGAIWRRRTSVMTNSLYAVAFLDANNGIAVDEPYGSSPGAILRTTDGGQT